MWVHSFFVLPISKRTNGHTANDIVSFFWKLNTKFNCRHFDSFLYSTHAFTYAYSSWHFQKSCSLKVTHFGEYITQILLTLRSLLEDRKRCRRKRRWRDLSWFRGTKTSYKFQRPSLKRNWIFQIFQDLLMGILSLFSESLHTKTLTKIWPATQKTSLYGQIL